MSAGLPPFVGSAIAYMLAFVVAYSAQRGWTFEGLDVNDDGFDDNRGEFRVDIGRANTRR